MRLSGLTAGTFVRSNSTGCFLFSRRVKSTEVSPCCGLEAGEGAEVRAAGVGAGAEADGLEDPAIDLRAGRAVSCCLKLDISEENMGRQS